MSKRFWLLSLLLLGGTSAFSANYRIGIGDDCMFVGACFSPSPLTISVGDTVTFYICADTGGTGPHNVVADDGSFRCAKGLQPRHSGFQFRAGVRRREHESHAPDAACGIDVSVK